MRALPKDAEKLIKGFEQLVLRVYDDKQPKKILKPGDQVLGVLTAGWGHTGGLKIGQEVSHAQAQIWFDNDIDYKAYRPLRAKLGPVLDELTDGQYGALISFVFNLGTGDPKKKEWTIWKLLRARQFDQVPAQMNLFVNWDGKKSNGLVRRRAAEVVLWSKEEPGSTESDPPSSITRRESTPATAIDPVAPQKSGTIIAAATSAVASAPLAISEVRQQIEPFKDDSAVVSNVYAGLATVAALLAILVLVLAWMKKRSQR